MTVLHIPLQYADERLDLVLAKIWPEYSRTQIKQWLLAGEVKVNDALAKPNRKLIGGEKISTSITPKALPAWQAEAIPLTIVYEDADLIVINKPAGLVVHPGAGNTHHTLLNALLHHAPSLLALPRAGILHRLDKNTSGLLVVAKTAAAFKDLSIQLKNHTLLREYQAIVYGSFISGGKINAPIHRHPIQRKRMAVDEIGKPAITHYRIAEKYRDITRLSVKLETGRTHQIRVHMAHIHHPVVGDPVYGGRVRLAKGMSPALIQGLRQFKRQALHAFGLGFIHPITHELVRFEAELPEDMQALIELLKADKASQ